MEDNISTKVCCRCKQSKPTSDFNFKDRAKGTLASECRQCHSDWNRQHYLNNRQTYIDNAKARNKQFSYDNFENLIEYLRDHPCVDCGESNPVVLDFDHVDRATKTRTISSMIRGWSWQAVLKEMAKCVVRCANCHRIRTAQQLGWRKALLEPA